MSILRSPVVLALDIGNTTAKVARFEGGSLTGLVRIEASALEDQLPARLRDWADGHEALYLGWTSVSAEIQERTLQGEGLPSIHALHIRATDPLPVSMGYRSPHTLGVDRVVGVIAARQLCPQGPLLVIDAGTALTYDLLDARDVYLGGAISPGIRLRARALHEHTARLPLIQPEQLVEPVGQDTNGSLQAGIVGGVRAEVQGMIDWYQAGFAEKLSVILTGGDFLYFENHVQKVNFVEPHLILHGIHYLVSRHYGL
jgi:type III pantothenate kinase